MDQAPVQGLSGAEAALRLKQFGANELPNPERRPLARIVWGIIRQPMFALLLAGTLVYLLLGEGLDAGLLGLFAMLSIMISIVQESRSERILESLRNLASPRALVIRDGRPVRIPGREVVPGDIAILSEGDRVPADAVLVSGDDLLADESLLTGESIPVRKKAGPDDPPKSLPGGDDQPWLYAGTMIARGNGMARIAATGLSSEMGKIGVALGTIVTGQPRLQAQLRWLVRDFAVIGGAVAGLVVLLIGLLRDSWLNALLAGVAVGMSVMPEEIPLVLAVFMAMGAWRISRVRVLTRRAAAIEALGSATVLCTDKTGTLTENRMHVELLAGTGAPWRPGAGSSPPPDGLLQAALGASAPLATDPMDRAIHDAALAADLRATGQLMKNYGLHPDLPATTYVWKHPAQSGTGIAYAKGAPEAIAQLCGLPATEKAQLFQAVDSFARQGLRLLAVAEAVQPMSLAQPLPRNQDDILFRYKGLIGFADPLRSGARAAVEECRTAGIRVIMITGDYAVTAAAIARQAGIPAGKVLEGPMLDEMDDAALAAAAREVCVFARVRPQQKLRLVEALKQAGEIVAMTGDGVNDAPAMKAAHIGIAMGSRGTDVAREASSLVLLDDDFASIVATIRLGRRIYDNLRKAIEYIVAIHIPIAGLALLPLFLGLPLILLPVHIALLEMVIDPTCSVVFEAEREEKDIMQRPPRPPERPLLSAHRLLWPVLQGVCALAIVAATLIAGARLGMPEPRLRALVYCILVVANLGLILVNRSFRASISDAILRPNPALQALAGIVLLVLGCALFWGPAQRLFHFAGLQLGELAWCLAAGTVLVAGLEAVKYRGLGSADMPASRAG